LISIPSSPDEVQ